MGIFAFSDSAETMLRSGYAWGGGIGNSAFADWLPADSVLCPGCVVNGPYANKRDGASELAVALERRYGSLHGARMTLEIEVHDCPFVCASTQLKLRRAEGDVNGAAWFSEIGIDQSVPFRQDALKSWVEGADEPVQAVPHPFDCLVELPGSAAVGREW